MRLEQLEYFVAAAEAGSISGAAQRLKVSQPAVSAALRSLEEELGGRLFSRGNQGISLTLLGRLTCDDARKMLKLARGMLARGRNAGARGAAQVCAQPLLSFHLTGNIIVPFRELHPDIDVFVRNVPNADIVAELKGGRAGIAVTLVALGLKIREQARSMGYDMVSLYTDERRMFIGAGHPLAAREKLTPEDLQSLRIAYYSRGTDTVSRLYAPYFGGEYRLANREDIDRSMVFISSTQAKPGCMEAIKAGLRQYGNFENVYETDIGTTIGGYSGPGTIGIVFARKQ